MCVCTQVIAAALCDAVAVHLAEVSGVETDAGRMQQHAAQTSQSALWRHAEVTRRVARDTAPLTPHPRHDVRRTAGTPAHITPHR